MAPPHRSGHSLASQRSTQTSTGVDKLDWQIENKDGKTLKQVSTISVLFYRFGEGEHARKKPTQQHRGRVMHVKPQRYFKVRV